MASTVDRLLKAARDTMDKGRDKVDEYVLQSRLDKTYRQLGALVYNQRKSGNRDEGAVDMLVKEIERVQAQLAGYNTPPASAVKVNTFDTEAEEAQEDAMFCDGDSEELPKDEGDNLG